MNPEIEASLKGFRRLLRPIRILLVLILAILFVGAVITGLSDVAVLGKSTAFILIPEIFFALPIAYIKKRALADESWQDSDELKTEVGMLVVRNLSLVLVIWTL